MFGIEVKQQMKQQCFNTGVKIQIYFFWYNLEMKYDNVSVPETATSVGFMFLGCEAVHMLYSMLVSPGWVKHHLVLKGPKIIR